ncbi:surface antigen BspA-like [Trichomonas vaginalis G3]|uniref:Surface antigen BspA-like n=1 Tax=Trichomonas vaginalis (strain ATCC PRA-98 / G3) TaxID=412133 RepID=A2DL47_TRIV3|nr:leucine-rich repeats (6 copies)-containing protein [Trichomonas vaginalis G3]EAY18838.1 surface antigen BspA-like [Trichomonas vaginalis G3]KAI5526056.1 leucine-rich repeats (6 copies)-containing protein [Trichomonas vaginalis G3]|eukprot:XP_001579824.1 surface antigen BspA-like [Trichomonas vaginalis G3]
MLLLLFYLSNAFTFETKKTTLYITGSGKLTASLVKQNCDRYSITIIHLGEGCNELEYGTFYYFYSLQAIYLPSTLKSITGFDLYYCFVLAHIYLPKGSDYLETDRYSALYTKGKNKLIRAPCILETFEFPPETTIIDDYAFFMLTIYGTFTISKNIRTANTNNFIQCKFSRLIMEKGCKLERISFWQWNRNLQYVFISKNVRTLAYQAFLEDNKLETIEFEEGSLLDTIDGMAFYNTKISRFIIPPKCTTIAYDLFYLDDYITYIYIPASVISIDVQAFGSTMSIQTIEIDPNNPVYKSKSSAIMTRDESVVLFIPPSTKSFTIPSAVSSFGATVFQACTSMTSIKTDSSNTKFDASGGIVYDKGYNTAKCCIGGITSVSLRSECTIIGSYCFFKCKNLQAITLSSRLTEIGVYSFLGTTFQRINIPASVMTFCRNCFYGSTVQYVTLNGNGPKNLKSGHLLIAV